MTKKKVILASASAWRRTILKKTGIPFDVEESGYDEDMSIRLSPEKLVRTFALEKAQMVAQRHRAAVVIGADTVLVRNGKILGKPKSKKEAIQMLKGWSGRSGCAFTGLAVIGGGKRTVHVIQTPITFRKLTAREIIRYVDSGEPMSGAGAFTIMEGGASFLSRIDGDFYNIAGLPLATLVPLLRRFGVEA